MDTEARRRQQGRLVCNRQFGGQQPDVAKVDTASLIHSSLLRVLEASGYRAGLYK
jgi:hypothetical protein